MSAHEVIQLIEEAGFVPAEQITCNPRARTGRDNLGEINNDVVTCFNPRARTGRDFYKPLHMITTSSFNPRARTGRDAANTILAQQQTVFQSTRPHGARPTIFLVRSAIISVSIHAPARGATSP